MSLLLGRARAAFVAAALTTATAALAAAAPDLGRRGAIASGLATLTVVFRLVVHGTSPGLEPAHRELYTHDAVRVVALQARLMTGRVAGAVQAAMLGAGPA